MRNKLLLEAGASQVRLDPKRIDRDPMRSRFPRQAKFGESQEYQGAGVLGVSKCDRMKTADWSRNLDVSNVSRRYQTTHKGKIRRERLACVREILNT